MPSDVLQSPSKSASSSSGPGRKKMVGFLYYPLVFVWFVLATTWPVLKWVMAMDCLVQLLRMFWHWKTPGMHAGWTFLLHYGAMIGVYLFILGFKPKGLD